MKIKYITILLILFLPLSGLASGFSGIKNRINYHSAKGSLKDLFYPLGFSKDGHFSFIRIPADEAIGCYLWNFQIKDIKNNKVAYKTGFTYDDCGTVKSVKSLIKNYEQLFINKHYIYKIEKSTLFPERFPLITENDKITSFLKKIKSVKKRNKEVKTVYFLILKSRNLGEKIVGAVFELSKTDTPVIYNSTVNGYIKSPFEERIVIIVESEQRGWRGPPNISKFRIFGASLAEGFIKK